MYAHYDFSHSLDTRSYLRLAHGEVQGVNVTRRYRVLVPALAAAAAVPLQSAYARIWPQRTTADGPLRLAFYLVNTLLMALFGLLLYQTARLHGATAAAAALAVAAVLSSQWAVYTSGLPLVDSLYLLLFALAFYAAQRAWGLGLGVALLLGPLAKESFVFLVPWLLVFGRRALPWPQQLLALAGGVGLAAGVRHGVDARLGAPAAESVANAFDHLNNLIYSLKRMFSVKGFGELFGIFGFFWLALLPGIAGRAAAPAASSWRAALGWPGVAFGGVVAVHMLLSGDLGRMGYLAAPVFTVALALALPRWLPTQTPSSPADEAAANAALAVPSAPGS